MRIEMTVDEFLRLLDNTRIDAAEIEINMPRKEGATKRLLDFKEVFEYLDKQYDKDVPKKEIIKMLSGTTYGYSKEIVELMILEAQSKGQIYERKEGIYAKA